MTATVVLALASAPALAAESADDMALARAVSPRPADFGKGVKISPSTSLPSACVAGLKTGSTAQVSKGLDAKVVAGQTIVTVYRSDADASAALARAASTKLRPCLGAELKAQQTATDKFKSFVGGPVALGAVGDRSRAYRFTFHYTEAKTDGVILFDFAFVQRKRVVIFLEWGTGIAKPDLATEKKELASMAARVS